MPFWRTFGFVCKLNSQPVRNRIGLEILSVQRIVEYVESRFDNSNFVTRDNIVISRDWQQRIAGKLHSWTVAKRVCLEDAQHGVKIIPGVVRNKKLFRRQLHQNGAFGAHEFAALAGEGRMKQDLIVVCSNVVGEFVLKHVHQQIKFGQLFMSRSSSLIASHHALKKQEVSP